MRTVVKMSLTTSASVIIAVFFLAGLNAIAGPEPKSVVNPNDLALVVDDKELGLSIHQVFMPDEMVGKMYWEDDSRGAYFKPWLTNSRFVAIRLMVPVKGSPIEVGKLVLVGNDKKLYYPKVYGIAGETKAFVFTYPTPWYNASKWNTITFPWVDNKERYGKMLVPNVKIDDKLEINLIYEVPISEKRLRIERRAKD